jgi:hypothetical protein
MAAELVVMSTRESLTSSPPRAGWPLTWWAPGDTISCQHARPLGLPWVYSWSFPLESDGAGPDISK